MIIALLAAWLGGTTVVQYEQHQDIRTLKQGYTQHEERITNAEERLESHARAINYLHNPKASAQPYKASDDSSIFGNL